MEVLPRSNINSNLKVFSYNLVDSSVIVLPG